MGLILVFGKRLKKLREEKGISQEELGKIIGQKKSNISKYENDKLQPSIETIDTIANYFGVTVDYLFGRSDDPKLPQITDPAMLKEIEEAKKMMEEASDRLLRLMEKHVIKQDEGPV